jgi:peptide-methionine (R)-S-oxide reductase
MGDEGRLAGHSARSASGEPALIALYPPHMDKTKKSDAEWREQLTPEQYEVTRKGGTERAFTGPYVDEKTKGMYHCIGCGTELFSSDTKFDSGTGWPSFTEPANLEHVELRPDNSLLMRRTEVVCKHCDAHLGHVFDDGPADKGGQRYCINGCALELKPAADAAS